MAERSKLSTGGWDIQHIFPGIDKDFPKEIIFASLNDAYPNNAVNEADNYRVAADGRRAWMISWWEFDGNQWFPQWRTSWHEKKYNKAVEFGVEGVSQLGWKLSGIEHHPRYLSDFAWKPGLSAKDFYKDYVSRVYGPAVTDEVAAMFERYDEWEARTPPAVPGDFRPMLLGAGWALLAIEEVPFAKDALETKKWKDLLNRAKECISKQNEFLKEDVNSIKLLNELLPKMTEDGKSWAKLLINRFEFRVLYMQATLQINQSYLEYDQVGRSKGIKAAAAVAKKYSERAVELGALAIEKYAEDVRNRGDLGVIGQLNMQYYDVIVRFNNKFNLVSPYVTIDMERFQANVAISYDFTNNNCWPTRDGVSTIETFTDDGKPAIKLSLGNKESQYNSRWIHQAEIDLQEAPYMDMYFRTSGNGPFSFMFQIDGSDEWHELSLLGSQGYTFVDSLEILSEINDGKWHRITWNLEKVVKERLGQDISKIKNLIVGNWKSVNEPVVVEFKDFNIGRLNLLDGLQLDNKK